MPFGPNTAVGFTKLSRVRAFWLACWIDGRLSATRQAKAPTLSYLVGTSYLHLQGSHAGRNGLARRKHPTPKRHHGSERDAAAGARLHRKSDTADQDASLQIKGEGGESSLCFPCFIFLGYVLFAFSARGLPRRGDLRESCSLSVSEKVLL